MPRSYYSEKPVPLRPLPTPDRAATVTRKQAKERLQEALGHEWTPCNDLKAAAALLIKALGPGWSISELRQLIRNGSLVQGQHWFKRGSRYSVDVIAIAEWHFNQEGEA